MHTSTECHGERFAVRTHTAEKKEKKEEIESKILLHIRKHLLFLRHAFSFSFSFHRPFFFFFSSPRTVVHSK